MDIDTPEIDTTDAAEPTETVETEPTEAPIEAEAADDLDSGDEAPPPEPKPVPKAKAPAPKAETKPKVEAPAPKPKRVVKGKVDGQEVDIELDDAGWDQVKARQIELAARKRMSEVAQRVREIEAMEKALLEDPLSVLEKKGADKRLAEQIRERMQMEQMSPEQRAFHEAQQKIAQYEREKQQAAEKQQQEAFEAGKRQFIAEVNRTFVPAAQAVGLPASPRVVARMAEVARDMADEQDFDATPEMIADEVKQELLAEHRTLYGSMEGDALLETLGKDTVEKVRKALIAKVKAKQAVKEEPKPEHRNGVTKPKKAAMNADEFRAYMERWAR